MNISEKRNIAAGSTSRAQTLSDSPSRLRLLSLFLLALVVRLGFLLVAGNNGTDAWIRYLIALAWLKKPGQVPSQVWLPLHFWLLGAATQVWHSEWSARLLTVLLGALTVIFFHGFVRRVFDTRVAFFSALTFALFGFHVAYSVTTSSEGPTIFFLMVGLYAWSRFYYGDGRQWLLLSGAGFSLACLCRLEPWLYIPVLTVSLLHPPQEASSWPTPDRWKRAMQFMLIASLGAAGWMTYSLLKWGDPLASGKVSAWLSVNLNIHQPLVNRVLAVPGALVVTLGPVISLLALIGIIRTLLIRQPPRMVAALLVLILGGANCFAAIENNSTMARYTLMYSWLLIPFAFDALTLICVRWPQLDNQRAFVSVVTFMLFWQAGIIAGARYAPPKIADRLATVSPTLPLPNEVQGLVLWLRTHTAAGDALVFDDFNYEAEDVIRYARVAPAQYFRVPYPERPEVVAKQVTDFIASRHPRFLVYSPSGHLKSVFQLDSSDEIHFGGLNLRLYPRWQQGNWQVYEIQYPLASDKSTTISMLELAADSFPGVFPFY